MGGIGCVVNIDQVEIDSEVVNVLFSNEELSVVDIGSTNESATVPSSVPLLASSVRVRTMMMFGRVIRLLISRFQLFIVYP